MKYDFVLTDEQQRLVEQNLALVDKTIDFCIQPNEKICDLGREDLHQESCIALCRAAATYDGASAKFSTYAATLIRNHLLDCCRAANIRWRNLPSVSLDIEGTEDAPAFPEPSIKDGTDLLNDRLDTAALLDRCKRRYTGVARLGVEALELKIAGFSGTDIARLYRTQPNMVGAWISRAAKKIQKDIAQGVEKPIVNP